MKKSAATTNHIVMFLIIRMTRTCYGAYIVSEIVIQSEIMYIFVRDSGKMSK